MPAPSATKAAIQRAIEATKAAGLMPSAVIVSKDGTIRVETLIEKPVDTRPNNVETLTPKSWAKR